MKIKAKVMAWENGESKTYEVVLTENILADLAEEIARERYGELHFDCLTLEPDLVFIVNR